MIHNEKEFIEWLDTQMNETIPAEIVAFTINIYESPFNIEIVGSSEFDAEDDDWACNEDWVPKERIVSISPCFFGSSWQQTQATIVALAKQYLLSNSKNVLKLKAANAFAVGFVDADLSYVQ